jgi:hypothetical protein
MIIDSKKRGGNYLLDAEAVAFTGAANAAAIVAAFAAKLNPNTVSRSFAEYPGVRFWYVHDLCTVYNIDHYAAQGILNTLMQTGVVTGPQPVNYSE